MVAAVRVSVGVEGGGGETVHTARKDTEKAQMGVTLVLHPAEIVVEVLRHAPIGAGDKTQVHQEVVRQFKLLSCCLRTKREYNCYNDTTVCEKLSNHGQTFVYSKITHLRNPSRPQFRGCLASWCETGSRVRLFQPFELDNKHEGHYRRFT